MALLTSRGQRATGQEAPCRLCPQQPVKLGTSKLQELADWRGWMMGATASGIPEVCLKKRI